MRVRVAGMLCTCALGLPAAASANNEVYISNEKDATISVIDTAKLEVVRTFSVGKRPRGITFSKDFLRFFVCASDDNAVQVYNTSNDALIHDLPSGEDPEQFACLRMENVFTSPTKTTRSPR